MGLLEGLVFCGDVMKVYSYRLSKYDGGVVSRDGSVLDG